MEGQTKGLFNAGTRKVREIGGSLTIALPRPYLNNLGIKGGELVEVWFDTEKIVLVPLKNKKKKSST